MANKKSTEAGFRHMPTSARPKGGSRWHGTGSSWGLISACRFDKDDKSPLEWYTMQKDGNGKLSDRLNVMFFDLVKIKELFGRPPEELSKLEKWGLFLSYVDDESKRE